MSTKLKYLLWIIFWMSLGFNLAACQTTASKTEMQPRKTKAGATINVSLGMAYLQRHDIYRARQKLILALQEDPTIPETWYAMAYFLETTHAITQANTYYLHALKISPHHGDVLNNYGTFLCRNGKKKESINYFLRAIQDINYLDTAAAYENAGLCTLDLGKTDNAILFFQQALNQDPKRASVLLELADIYTARHEFTTARYYLNKFLNLQSPTLRSYQIEKKIDRAVKKQGS